MQVGGVKMKKKKEKEKMRKKKKSIKQANKKAPVFVLVAAPMLSGRYRENRVVLHDSEEIKRQYVRRARG